MVYSPIALVAPNYRDYTDYWLKAYEPGTTTPKIMALDSDAAVIVVKLQLNADGFLKSGGGALVIPYLQGSYDLWLFPTEAEADVNDTINAKKLADNINALNQSVVNDLTLSYDFDTVAAMTASAIVFPEGKRLVTKEHTTGKGGGASYIYTAGASPEPVGSPDVIGSNYADIQRTSGQFTAAQFGAFPDANDHSDELIAFYNRSGSLVQEPGTYLISKNMIMPSNISLYAYNVMLWANAGWTDLTGNHYAGKRSVVLIEAVDNVRIWGLEVKSDLSVSFGNTPFMMRNTNHVRLASVSGTHSDTRTLSFNPFDLESNCTDIKITDSYFRNETGAVSGLCSIRQLSTAGITKNIKVLDCLFDKDSGDEVLAVYGVLGKTTDIEIEGNTFNSSSAKRTHGTLISMFPLATVAGDASEVNNVKFTNNLIIATAFVSSIIRVGSTEDVSNTCNNIFIDRNTLVVANATPESILIRYIKNVGDNVTCIGNSISQVDTNICKAFIGGPFKQVSENHGNMYAEFIFIGCSVVSGNIGLTNFALNGYNFYNVKRFSNNDTVSDSGGRQESYTGLTEVVNNKMKITGVGSSSILSSNDLGTGKLAAYTFKDNDIETTQILDYAIDLDTSAAGPNICQGNTFKGVSPTEVFLGVNNSFSTVTDNSWWDYNDMTSAASPYRSLGYNKMIPLGNFVTNSAIGVATGTVVLGWSKQEVNAVAADWKEIKATI